MPRRELTEALSKWDSGVSGPVGGHLGEIVDAARRVLDGEPAWECGTYSTVHFDEALEDDGSCSHCRSRAEMAGCGEVLVVRPKP